MKKKLDTHYLKYFIQKAKMSTYVAGRRMEKLPKRKGFIEYTYDEGEWSYRDSYAGFLHSAGMEVVRKTDVVVWSMSYAGETMTKNKAFAREIFKFLKSALSVDNKGFVSFRGPANLRLGDWEYIYKQSGDVKSFEGEEKIKFEKTLVFTQKVMGGVVE